MEIITAIWRHLIKLLILNLILVPFMVLAPAILVVLPLVLIFDNPSGDFSGTVAKATFYMFGGLVASFFFEMLFLSLFRFAPYSLFSSASRFALWFVLFPFATFAPVILLWLRRRWRREEV